MNTLLLFFALPIAVIIISIALQKIFRNPFLVAAIIFAFAFSFLVKYLIKSRDFEHQYKLATIDGLTELYNHRYFQDALRNQIEISKRDARVLGVNPPVRRSGDVSDSLEVILETEKNSVKTNGLIIANRHIHVDRDIINEYHLEGIEKVSIRVNTIKGGILENVFLKESPKAYFELHIDTDDANAFLLSQNDEVEIILEK